MPARRPQPMIELRPLASADAEAHCAGEDDEIVRWLSGGRSTVEGTKAYIASLAENAERGAGKRAFGVWLDGRLAGYVDFDPDLSDGLQPGEVNVSYATHPWARGRGVAVEAVRLVCGVIPRQHAGSRAAIRVEPENLASVRVAEKAGFEYVREFVSGTDKHPDGSPATMRLYLEVL